MNSKKVKLNTNAVEVNTGNKYSFDIKYFVYKQDGMFIAYCPSVDIATSANNFKDAVANFSECFQLYVETCADSSGHNFCFHNAQPSLQKKRLKTLFKRSEE